MARKTHSPRSRPVGHGSTLVGVLIGLVIGALIALAVAWYMTKTPLPFLNKGDRPSVEKQDAKLHPEPGAGTASALASPAPLPGKPGDKPMERPRFDFYKILPGGEEAAPVPERKAQAVEPVPAETLFLQAGSFQKSEDADNLRAKLALLGMEASVQPVSVPDKGLLHRVRIGPFRKPEEMSRTRALLAENGIQAKVVKLKEGAPN